MRSLLVLFSLTTSGTTTLAPPPTHQASTVTINTLFAPFAFTSRRDFLSSLMTNTLFVLRVAYLDPAPSSSDEPGVVQCVTTVRGGSLRCSPLFWVFFFFPAPLSLVLTCADEVEVEAPPPCSACSKG